MSTPDSYTSNGERKHTGEPIREQQPNPVLRGECVDKDGAQESWDGCDHACPTPSNGRHRSESDADPNEDDCRCIGWPKVTRKKGTIRNALSTRPSTQPRRVVFQGTKPNCDTMICLWFASYKGIMNQPSSNFDRRSRRRVLTELGT